MFTSKSKENTTPDAPPAKVGASIIAAGTVIKGDIDCSGDIRIDGGLKGHVRATNKVFIGPEGYVDGDISCNQADVLGHVKGKIMVKDLLNLRGKALVEGDLFTGKLQVEPTASFNGKCHMGNAQPVVAAIADERVVEVASSEYAEAEA